MSIHRMTWLHSVNPTVKLAHLLLVFVVALGIHHPTVLGISVMLWIGLLIGLSGARWKTLIIWSVPLALSFMSTAFGMMAFGQGTTTWWQWGLFHFTEESVLRGIHLGFRAMLIGLSGLLFLLTTSPIQLCYSLMQQCRLSPKFAYAFLAAFHFLPIIYTEALTIRDVLRIRGVQKSTFPGVTVWRKMRHYSVPLLARSIRHAQRVALAMASRQFEPSAKRTYFYTVSLSRYDVYFSLLMVVFWVVAWSVGTLWSWRGITDVRTVA